MQQVYTSSSRIYIRVAIRNESREITQSDEPQTIASARANLLSFVYRETFESRDRSRSVMQQSLVCVCVYVFTNISMLQRCIFTYLEDRRFFNCIFGIYGFRVHLMGAIGAGHYEMYICRYLYVSSEIYCYFLLHWYGRKRTQIFGCYFEESVLLMREAARVSQINKLLHRYIV